MINILLDYSQQAKTYDDSGWGHKSSSQYNIKLYSDCKLSLLIQGNIIMMDASTQSYFQTDSSLSIFGSYELKNSSSLGYLKVYEYYLKPSEVILETISKESIDDQNGEYKKENKQLLGFNFRVHVNESNSEIEVVFDEYAKDEVFIDFYSNPKWFYSNLFSVS